MFHRQLELDNTVNKLHPAHLQLYLASGSFPRCLQADFISESDYVSRLPTAPTSVCGSILCNHINWLCEKLDL